MVSSRRSSYSLRMRPASSCFDIDRNAPYGWFSKVCIGFSANRTRKIRLAPRQLLLLLTPASYSGSESLLAGPQLYHCRYLRAGCGGVPAFARLLCSFWDWANYIDTVLSLRQLGSS